MKGQNRQKGMSPQVSSKPKRGDDSQKFFIKTFGCQMNKYDSGVMEECLAGSGYAIAGREEDADVILLNTCSVREHAEKRVEGILGQLKSLKASKPGLVLGVCGCMAQKEGKKLVEKFPQVDLVCGTHRFHDIGSILGQVIENREVVVDIGEDDDGVRNCAGSINRTPTERTGVMNAAPTKICAFVSVMRGCDSFCSYCVVPYLRGREKSRSSDMVVEEIEKLAGSGVREVCLLGQNIAAYGKGLDEKIDFAGLLEKVNKVEGILRIRFLTSHPGDVKDNVLLKIKELDKVCESIHLPLQAGSDRILKLMKRRYTPDYYKKLIEKVRNLVPDASITTDIIVGFPGETDEEFKETRKMMEEVRFDDAFIYKYSTRPGTKAVSMSGQVEDNVKQERIEELLALQKKTSGEKNKELTGGKVEVLVEGKSRKDSSSLFGKTRTDKNVVFEGKDELIGKLVDVKIAKAGPATLTGSINRTPTEILQRK